MFNGSLEIAGVTDLLVMIGRARKTGVLRLWGPSPGVIRLIDGEVAFASSRADHDLGAVLVRAGFLAAEGVAEAVAARDPARCLATVLRRHQIDPERVDGYVRQQTEEAIWELDRWRGAFSFDPARDDDPLAGAFRYLVPSVLAGVRRRDGAWARLTQRVPSIDLALRQAPVAPGDDSELTLSRPQCRVLTAADGRTVREIAVALDLGLFATCELVAGLLDAHLVVLGGVEASPEGPIAGPATVTRSESTVTFETIRVAPPVVEPALAVVGAGVGSVIAPAAAAIGFATHAAVEPAWGLALAEPVRNGAASLPARLAPELPAVGVVASHQQPGSELILRLLSAVKAL